MNHPADLVEDPSSRTGWTCRMCFRPGSMATGKPEHARGRLPGVTNVAYRIARVIKVRVVPRCEDCNAQLQFIGSFWRCPWTTNDRYHVEGDTIRCTWPYNNPDRVRP